MSYHAGGTVTRSYLDTAQAHESARRIKEAYKGLNMVILTIYYLDASNQPVSWSTDPMPVNAAMDRIMRFVQAGADAITNSDTGRMDVVLTHGVTGMTITPAK